MGIIKFLLGLCAVLILGAFLAPLISPFFSYPFPRVLSRTVLVLFLLWLLVWVLRNNARGLKARGLKVAGLKACGLFWERTVPSGVFAGFLLGFLVLLAMTLVEIPLGVRSWQFTFDQVVWPLKLVKYALSALAVAVLEELLFRGMLFGVLTGRFSAPDDKTRTAVPISSIISAAVITNLIYSFVHFLRYSSNAPIPHPGFLTGFQIYGEIGRALLDPLALIPSAVGLFLFGCVLSYAYVRTGNLAVSIGLHAGAVFFLKLDRWFIHVDSEAHKFWFGGTDLHACVLGWAFILLMGLGVYWVTRKNNFQKGEAQRL